MACSRIAARAARAFGLATALGAAISGIALPVSSDASASEKVLYSFQGGSDGADPFSALIADASGKLYGTTAVGGGGANCDDRGFGCGTVFELAPDGTESVLYAFQGGDDGALPEAGLVADGAGDFYGTTVAGGGPDKGTVFKLSSDGTETVLYAFNGGSDGETPDSNLILDKHGNLYGTTVYGGNLTGPECGDIGCGTVFEVTPAGTETILYAFQGGSDGLQPSGGLIRDVGGSLYGMAGGGGSGSNCAGFGCGTVFSIAPNGTKSVLYSFQGGSDGSTPVGGLIKDQGGNLYGATLGGGGPCDCGTVFKLAPDGTETVLYAFQEGNDGGIPAAGIIMDKAGNLYGTTFAGGGMHCSHTSDGCGTVFKLAPDGTETVLFAFFGKHGVQPEASLLMAKHELLYGTASAGGKYNDGVVFSVKE
jgi:uncharacterized repeat protein (TIGR03803 family)